MNSRKSRQSWLDLKGASAEMNIPTDYLEGYEKALKLDPHLADKYMAHTHIGDPLGEAMTDDLAELDAEEQWRLIQVAMDDDMKRPCETRPPHCEHSSKMRKGYRTGWTTRDSPRASACFTEIRA